MTEFRKPSPEMEEVYEKIIALADEGVWIPATSNGGLRQLLAELEVRGWKVIPPEETKTEFLGGIPFREFEGTKMCLICGEALRNCGGHSPERIELYLLRKGGEKK